MNMAKVVYIKRRAVDEDYIGVKNMEHSDGKTLGSRSDFETKWNNSPDKDPRSLGRQMKDFGRGFVKSLPSMALTAAVCWPAGVLMAIGALHDRFEKKVNNTLLNPKTFADWIANTNTDGVKNDKKKDSSFGVKTYDSSTKKENPYDVEERPGNRKASTTRNIKDASVNSLEMKKYFVELDNGEVMKLYAISDNEAKEQAKTMISSMRGKYKTMNDLFEEGAHTYRIVLSDGSIVYLTAESRENAVSIANYTAAELKKLYASLGVKQETAGKVKIVTDEGIIPIPAPAKIENVVENTAPDPDSVPKLKPEISKEFYTNEAAKVYTYKLRINFNTVYICAKDDNEAKDIAVHLHKEISGYKGTILSFLTGSVSGIAWGVKMSDGDQYIVCETSGGEDPKTKVLAMVAGKYKAMMKYCSKNVQSFLQTKMKDGTNIPDVTVASAKRTKIPQKFKNLNLIVLSKITDGAEKIIYKSQLARDSSDENTKQLTPQKIRA